MLKTGVIKTSFMENERRLPIFPAHVPRLPDSIRQSIWFESGYGADFGYDDAFFAEYAAGTLPRSTLFELSDLLILPKPMPQDLMNMKEGQILWGWPHCVQQRPITQITIDRKLTLLAWEAMFNWSDQGERLMHIFYRNNELAGYAAVHHVLELTGADGYYGPRKKAVIIGYGSVGRGIVQGLLGRGFNDILVVTKRESHLVANRHLEVQFSHLLVDADGLMWVRERNGTTRKLIDVLAEADIIGNAVLQDTDKPMMFVQPNEVERLKPRSIILDISCDEGMGFPFAVPTSFEKPMFMVDPGITYYAVDHTPSYLWNAASREISNALIPYLEPVMMGPDSWQQNETIRRAVEIQDGKIVNSAILRFQNRKEAYPHEVIG